MHLRHLFERTRAHTYRCLGGTSKQHIFWSLPTHMHNSYSHYILGHHNGKVFQLQASRVAIATSNSAAKVNTNLYIKCNLGRYWVQAPSLATPSIACCPELSVFTGVQATMNKLGYVHCSFGSLVLWISLGLPPDLLHRSNCHVEK